MQNNASFFATLEQRCVVTRLKEEVWDALRELRECPGEYLRNTFKRDGGGYQRQVLLRMGLAIGISTYATAFVLILVFWSFTRHETPAGETARDYIRTPLAPWPTEGLPESEDRAGGGGGGGRGQNTPPSEGDPPAFMHIDPVVAPRPETPLRPPVIPIIETLKVDPRIQVERDELTPTGLPDGATVLLSAGPGSRGGIGTGVNGGLGPGVGPGFLDGSGGNTGGLESQIGGRRPTLRQAVVDAQPVLLNEPRPLYTEEARREKIQGVVRVRILVDASGAVKEVIVTKGLPGGLTEQAIRAAYQMRFRPAIKDGRHVSYWLGNVEIEFNLR